MVDLGTFSHINVGYYAAPTLVDVTGDGMKDLVVGNNVGNIKVWLNSGSNTWPTEATGAANPFDGINVGGYAAPTLVDVNGDGKLDLVVGDYIGKIRLWLNSGSNTWPTEATGADNPFDGIAVGNGAAPTLVDVNGDGKNDLVVGNWDGNIKVWLNSGSNTWPTEATGAANPFDGIAVGNGAAPTLVDVNGDGYLDLVVGNNAGNIKGYSGKVLGFPKLQSSSNNSVLRFLPNSTIIGYDSTIKNVLDFVTKINNIYNTSRYSCGCFYTNWLTTSSNTESVIGREQMFEFIINLNSGDNDFSKTVQIYNEIIKLQRRRDDYRQRRLGHCCNYNAMIEKLKEGLPRQPVF